MGALGPCGRELCCSSFLSKYGNVSIKMAKNQNLTLNYSKLNGVCGQLKCCLSYEEEVYSQKRKKLPQEGSFIQTYSGDCGKITKLNILSEVFDLLTDKGKIKRFTFDQVKKKFNENEYKFPRKFENISDETSNVVGEKELTAKKLTYANNDKNKLSKKAAKFAIERLIEISDFLPEKEPGEREKMLEQAKEDIKNSLQEKIKDEYNPYQDMKSTSAGDYNNSATESSQDKDKEMSASDKGKKPYRNNRKKNYRHNNKNFKNKNNSNNRNNRNNRKDNRNKNNPKKD